MASFANEFGLDTDVALKVACGFGGGVGAMGGPCGAVTGGIMVIGLTCGQTRPEDKTAKEKTYGLVQEFVRRFKERHQSIDCKELINTDLSTPEGFLSAIEKKLFTTVCPAFVRDAAELLQELLP